MKFTDLTIHPDLIRAATDNGFESLTEIQSQCLPPALEGRDIAGISQTGTGKTVAFLLPILDKIFKQEPGTPKRPALILTPTRELCLQIAEEAQKLCTHRSTIVAAIYGGEGYDKQERVLRSGPDIIVATPGRLIDYLKQRIISFEALSFLVLDEADRMFDMGFIRDIRYIMRHCPTDVQTMLFSATLSYYVLRLASDYMKDPIEVKIETESVAVDKIEQHLFHLGRHEKLAYLINQVRQVENIRSIVFTNYKNEVTRIVQTLHKFGIPATGISSLLDQKKRLRLLKDFKLGKYSILVATDVASRGIDVDDISHVFNYDLPPDSESYVHRIGRTARAGKSGISYSYCSETDYDALPRIERLIGKKINVGPIDPEFLEFPEGEFTHFVDENHPLEPAHKPGGQRRGGPNRQQGRGQDRYANRGNKPRDPRGGDPRRDNAGRQGNTANPPREGGQGSRNSGGTSGNRNTRDRVGSQDSRNQSRYAQSGPRSGGRGGRDNRNDSRQDRHDRNQGGGHNSKRRRGRDQNRRRDYQPQPVKPKTLWQKIKSIFSRKKESD